MILILLCSLYVNCITTVIYMLQCILDIVPSRYGDTMLIPYYDKGVRYEVLIPVAGHMSSRREYISHNGNGLLSYIPPPGVEHFIDRRNVYLMGNVYIGDELLEE